MENTLIDFSKFVTPDSKFSASLSGKSGYIVFSNSGRRGDIKYFTLGLDSFLQIFKDINMHFDKFKGNDLYDEDAWRNLGSKYYSDPTANAMSTVQSKPMFVTISKIIMWANELTLSSIDPEKTMDLHKESIEKTIEELTKLVDLYTPTFAKGSQINIPTFPVKDSFSYKSFFISLGIANFQITNDFVLRFISSLLTKPFVILTGLSGSGKTKLAQAYVEWLCDDKTQYCIVPVGADWTNREPLLGFPNSLKEHSYEKPDNLVLDLIIIASNNLEKPYFLILDEMNLSHVERYFADFLSTMESGDEISLHANDNDWNGVPAKISLPKNLFVIGTVNIDETTYMFSPKVLDRANVIEFRVTAEEMKSYLKDQTPLNLGALEKQGISMAEDFILITNNKTLQVKDDEAIKDELINFFTSLKVTGAEFGYRSAAEILRFAGVVNLLEPAWSKEQILDAAIMQKLLPKVHGSRRKLEPVLKTLGKLCFVNDADTDKYFGTKVLPDAELVKYPISLEKILRMYNGLIDNGFTSYAEA